MMSIKRVSTLMYGIITLTMSHSTCSSHKDVRKVVDIGLMAIRLRTDLEEARQVRVQQWLGAIASPQQGTKEDPIVIESSDSETEEEPTKAVQPLPILEQERASISSRRFEGANLLDPNPGFTEEQVAALNGEKTKMDPGHGSTQTEQGSFLWNHLLAIERNFIMESQLRRPKGPHTPPHSPSKET